MVCETFLYEDQGPLQSNVRDHSMRIISVQQGPICARVPVTQSTLGIEAGSCVVDRIQRILGSSLGRTAIRLIKVISSPSHCQEERDSTYAWSDSNVRSEVIGGALSSWSLLAQMLSGAPILMGFPHSQL